MDAKRRALILVLLLAAWFGGWGCAAQQLKQYLEKPYFEQAPPELLRDDRDLYYKALKMQMENHPKHAITLWQDFLKKHPRSFEAHNNLGHAYYADDQMNPAIAEFETALTLEPNNPKIRHNLARALNVQAVLMEENRDYDTAIDYWQRIAKLKEITEREKVQFRIEALQDKIFEQVQRSDRIEDYESFLERYPDSPGNAEMARRRIQELKEIAQETRTLPDMQMPAGTQSGFSSEEEGILEEAVPPPEKTSPVPAEGSSPPLPPDQAGPFEREANAGPPMTTVSPKQKPEPPKEPLRPPEKEVRIMTRPEPKPSISPQPGPLAEVASLPPASEKKVQITTEKDPLRVRSGPSQKYRILSYLEKGTQVPLLGEKEGWYKVEFSEGKTGWISAKFSQIVE